MLLFPFRNIISCLGEKLDGAAKTSPPKTFDTLIYNLGFIPALSTSTKPKYTPRKRLVT